MTHLVSLIDADEHSMSIVDARVQLAGLYWLLIRKIFYWENRRIYKQELGKLSKSLREHMKLKKDEVFGFIEKVCAICDDESTCTCTVGDEFESQQEIGESSTMPDDGDGADSSIGE